MSTPVVDVLDLAPQVTDVNQILDQYLDIKRPHLVHLPLNATENKLAAINRAVFRSVRKNEDGSWACRVTLDRQPELISLAEDLRRANNSHITLLRRIDNGRLVRLGRRPRLYSSDATQEAQQVIAKLEDFISFVDGESEDEGEAGDCDDDWDIPEAGHAVTQASTSGAVHPASVGDEGGVAGTQGERMLTEALAEQKTVQALVSRLASAAAESEQRDAGWQKAIKELKEVVEEQQKGMVALKAEMFVAVAAEAAQRETEVQALQGKLEVEKVGREQLQQEVKSLKEELSVLRLLDTSEPSGTQDWSTEGGLDSLIRRILSSDRFNETITRLLSLTVGHTLSLAVGCFAIVDPERVLQVAGACEIQHSLAALGVLHDLPAWAGERDRLFKGLVEEALDADTAVETELDSRALDEAMLAMLKAGDIGDVVSGEAKAEEAAFAEEREKIKSAWVDIVQAIKAQGQVALSEITQHRTAATETISAAGAEAVRVICEQSEIELLSMEGKADKLDRAMLDFGRLYPVPGALSIAPTVEAETFPTPPPASNDLATILALLKQLIPAQQPAGFPSIPPVEAFSNAAHPSPRPSAPSATTDSPTAPGPTTTSALASVFGPTVTGPRR